MRKAREYKRSALLMKNIKLAFTAYLILTFAVDSFGQDGIDSLMFTDRMWSLKKKSLVLQVLDLTEAEKASFWPVYDGYHTAIRYLEMEFIFLNSQYIKEQNGGSEHRLERLSAQILKNDLLLAKLRRIYFKRFKKALSPLQASAFMQFDQSWRSMMREELLNGVYAHQASGKFYSKN